MTRRQLAAGVIGLSVYLGAIALGTAIIKYIVP